MTIDEIDQVDETPDTLTELVRHLCTLSATIGTRAQLRAINRGARTADDPDLVRAALMELPIDGHTFESTYQRERRDQIAALAALWHQGSSDPRGLKPEARGFLGLLVATLCGLEVSEVQRQHRLDSETTTKERVLVEEHAATIATLFADDDVRDQTIRVYFPRGGPWWTHTLDPRTLTFWRAGTTSAILTVDHSKKDDPDKRRAKRYALKVVWLPFLRIDEIARATASYAALYTLPDELADSAVLVPVHASGNGWVIMDFVRGKTLDEHLTDQRRLLAAQARSSLSDRVWNKLTDPEDDERIAALASGDIDLTTMQSIARGLCRAMSESQRAARLSGNRPDLHGDLTPANIIVRDGRLDELVLIDFGVNHLFTRTASVGDEAKAGFIAPEARVNKPGAKSDLFSVGQILIDAGAQRVDGRGVVPDRFYDSYPSVAELLEDLLDAEPRYRLGGSGDDVDYLALQATLQFELDVAARMGESSSRRASSVGAVLWELRAPFNGEPWRQLRTYAAIRRWPGREQAEQLLAYATTDEAGPPGPGSGRTSGDEWSRRLETVRQTVGEHIAARRADVLYLRAWSILAAAVSFVSLFISFWWLVRGLPFSDLPPRLFVVKDLVDGPTYLYHYLDPLAARPLVFPYPGKDLAIRLSAFSYALLHAKLYQAVYARMRPIPAPSVNGSSVAARAAGTWMRVMPFLGSFLVLWVTLRDVDDWIWAVIIGQTVTVVGNLAVHRYVRGALSTGARWLNTVPKPYEQIAGYDSVRSWVRGSLFEAGVCWSVGLLIFAHALQDVWLYASLIAALNIFLLYLVKCGLEAPEIRVALHRAAFSARRLTRRSAGTAPRESRPARPERVSP